MQISEPFNHIFEFSAEACAKVTSMESVAVITPQYAKTAFSVPMAEHVARTMKNVNVASTVGGFQKEFTTALKDDHMEAISAGCSAASQRLELMTSADIEEMQQSALISWASAPTARVFYRSTMLDCPR